MIGVDIESIKRVDHLLNSKPSIIRKFFSTYEWRYAEKKSNKSQTLTGIWCAKEAVVKAFSNIYPIFITDVKIKHHMSGIPYVFKIDNKKIKSNYIIDISISHTKDYATAVAIVKLL
mgnify:CR=1 FL=1|tara:strand:+ start:226 stop:576 length:351 start_codon:yes stop_codon:yes gene_type:complete